MGGRLIYSDDLKFLRTHVSDASVNSPIFDLQFNSQVTYNALFRAIWRACGRAAQSIQGYVVLERAGGQRRLLRDALRLLSPSPVPDGRRPLGKRRPEIPLVDPTAFGKV